MEEVGRRGTIDLEREVWELCGRQREKKLQKDGKERDVSREVSVLLT